MNKILLAMLALIFTGVTISSCNKNDETQEIENYVDESVVSLETRGGLGRGGCFEIIFPQSISLPDGSTVEVESYLQLRDMIRRWIKFNGRPAVRPIFAIDWVYPMTVLTADGETVTINSREDLFELRKECLIDKSGQGMPCFRISYPVSVEFPDGSVMEFGSPGELVRTLAIWKKQNPASVVRPYLVFPITIIMEDGTILQVNSREELRAIKVACN